MGKIGSNFEKEFIFVFVLSKIGSNLKKSLSLEVKEWKTLLMFRNGFVKNKNNLKVFKKRTIGFFVFFFPLASFIDHSHTEN